jgi:hypothetical protein
MTKPFYCEDTAKKALPKMKAKSEKIEIGLGEFQYCSKCGVHIYTTDEFAVLRIKPNEAHILCGSCFNEMADKLIEQGKREAFLLRQKTLENELSYIRLQIKSLIEGSEDEPITINDLEYLIDEIDEIDDYLKEELGKDGKTNIK